MNFALTALLLGELNSELGACLGVDLITYSFTSVDERRGDLGSEKLYRYNVQPINILCATPQQIQKSRPRQDDRDGGVVRPKFDLKPVPKFTLAILQPPPRIGLGASSNDESRRHSVLIDRSGLKPYQMRQQALNQK
ncbi:hypothetical protein BY996DRAFT_6426170 [Phakopsora pachyrhizi]|nr:hypothetical protein BY996DRAFT_6426170 [Phakopsora pachyrhizi]